MPGGQWLAWASTCQGAPKSASDHQKLEEVRKDSPLRLSEGTRPCPHLDFRLLAPRTEKGYFSGVF